MTTLAARWRAGRAPIGLWSGVDDPVAAEIIGRSGFDFVAVDLQHGFASLSSLPRLLHALHHTPSASVVRVAWNRPEDIMRALDLGADAVIVPMVDTAEQAAQAVSASRYAAGGRRSWGPLWTDPRRGSPDPAEGDARAACVVMIETRQGLDSLDAILAVEDLAAIYVGPNDLSLSLGLGRVSPADSPELHEVIEQIAQRARQAQVPVGFDCVSPQEARYWLERGMDFTISGRDTSLLRSSSEAAARAIREAAVG